MYKRQGEQGLKGEQGEKGEQGPKGDQGTTGPQGPNAANLIYRTDGKTTVEASLSSINNNLATKMPKSGGTFTGPITAIGNIAAQNGRLIDKNGYVVSSGGGSNTVALVWSSAMRFDVYVDGTFVGTPVSYTHLVQLQAIDTR